MSAGVICLMIANNARHNTRNYSVRDSGPPRQPKHYVHECGRMYFVNELKEPIQCGRCREIIDICKPKKIPWYRKLWTKKTGYEELSSLEGKKDS